MKELEKNENNRDACHQIAFLKSQIILRNDGATKARQYLLSRVHILPDCPLLRKVLSAFLLKNFSTTKKYARASARFIESSIQLDLKNVKKNLTSATAKSLALASKAMQVVDKIQQKILAQKAVHVNPGCKEAWSALIMCK